MRWVVGSIPHGRPTELFHVPTSAPQLNWYNTVLSCLWDDAYERIVTLKEWNM